MIKCHLSAIMGAKRLKISDVVRESGINRNTVTRLYHETNNRIEFETLEKLCRYLDCQVGDLLEVVNDDEIEK
ncbi:XRE family transcriptional regulator [Vibrio albus]|uniref:XRE family transcriptional regulator n=1 Tax=Vibrio albus TaxID=2200953 RepID=A0A2U3B9K3_9VIBR|nr:helix-turn-helix transcriptional regulator [Vibrio albus]PWI33451.1 XRE family transcriptional regulator [Vibrio albus]